MYIRKVIKQTKNIQHIVMEGGKLVQVKKQT